MAYLGNQPHNFWRDRLGYFKVYIPSTRQSFMANVYGVRWNEPILKGQFLIVLQIGYHVLTPAKLRMYSKLFGATANEPPNDAMRPSYLAFRNVDLNSVSWQAGKPLEMCLHFLEGKLVLCCLKEPQMQSLVYHIWANMRSSSGSQRKIVHWPVDLLDYHCWPENDADERDHKADLYEEELHATRLAKLADVATNMVTFDEWVAAGGTGITMAELRNDHWVPLLKLYNSFFFEPEDPENLTDPTELDFWFDRYSNWADPMARIVSQPKVAPETGESASDHSSPAETYFPFPCYVYVSWKSTWVELPPGQLSFDRPNTSMNVYETAGKKGRLLFTISLDSIFFHRKTIIGPRRHSLTIHTRQNGKYYVFDCGAHQTAFKRLLELYTRWIHSEGQRDGFGYLPIDWLKPEEVNPSPVYEGPEYLDYVLRPLLGHYGILLERVSESVVYGTVALNLTGKNAIIVGKLWKAIALDVNRLRLQSTLKAAFAYCQEVDRHLGKTEKGEAITEDDKNSLQLCKDAYHFGSKHLSEHHFYGPGWWQRMYNPRDRIKMSHGYYELHYPIPHEPP